MTSNLLMLGARLIEAADVSQQTLLVAIITTETQAA